MGVATGTVSGFFVLDVDGEAGKESLRELETQHGKIPDTVEQQTGSGGKHIFFKLPKHAVKNTIGLRPGLDIRGDGGYIVVPPSRHSSGGQYTWELSSHPDEVPLMDAPDWLVNIIKMPPGEKKYTPEFFQGVGEGQRDDTCVRLVGRYIRLGLTDWEIENLLAEWNKKNVPPMPDTKKWIKQKIQSIRRAEERKHTLKPDDFTDVGEARVLAREYGEKLRFSEATGWIVYNEKVWRENDIEAQRLSQLLTDRQLQEARSLLWIARNKIDKAVESEDNKTSANLEVADAEVYRKYVLSRRKSNAISAALKEAKPSLQIEVGSLDTDPFLLNTPAGAIDLRTGGTRPHSTTDYCTKITSVSPSREGRALWEDFIKVITCDRPDLAEYLQLLAGETIIGRVYRENLQIAFGSGKNGKSTFYNSLSRVLGNYSGQISAETLTTGHRTGKNWELAELRGKRLVVAPELEEGTRLDSAFVKKICSTDKILGEQKFKTPFTFEPSHTTVLYTNHLPRVGSSEVGIWRRLVTIPFNAIIGEDKDVKNYADFLIGQAGGAILAWAIEGAGRLIKANFQTTVPTCALQAAEKYREANDWLGNFLAECCEINKTHIEKGGDLYREYRFHAERTGEYIRSKADFKAAIELAGYEVRRTERGAIYRGLRLAPNFSTKY